GDHRHVQLDVRRKLVALAEPGRDVHPGPNEDREDQQAEAGPRAAGSCHAAHAEPPGLGEEEGDRPPLLGAPLLGTARSRRIWATTASAAVRLSAVIPDGSSA